MLNRSWPRLRTASSIANGNSLTSSLPSLPVKNASSSWSVPRATTPSTSGRALDPSAKNPLGRSPRYFGWLCMSWRQPEASMIAATAQAARPRLHLLLRVGTHPHAREISRNRAPSLDRVLKRRLLLDIAHFFGAQTLQKASRPRVVELRILRFDRQEEPILAGVLGEALDVEHRVVGHRQPVEREHAEDRRQRGKKDRQLEGDRHEHRPAQIRAAAD